MARRRPLSAAVKPAEVAFIDPFQFSYSYICLIYSYPVNHYEPSLRLGQIGQWPAR